MRCLKISPKKFVTYFCLLLILNFISSNSSAEMIRLQLAKLPTHFTLSAQKIDFRYIQDLNENISSKSQNLKKIELNWVNHNIWKIKRPGFSEITINADKIHFFVHNLDQIESQNQKLLPSTIRSYSGEIILSGHEGLVRILGLVDLDRYLAGVLSAELPKDFPLESFKAQAVAARTYAYQKMRLNIKKEYDLEASVLDQAFNLTTPTHKILSAIDETRSEILTSDSGEISSVYYHADCGGKTENSNEVWGQEKDQGKNIRNIANSMDFAQSSQRSQSCDLHSHSHWKFALKVSDFRDKIQSKFKDLSDEDFKLKIHRRTVSGRVKSLMISTKSLKSILISGQELRQLLGFEKLKSTNFQLIQKNEDLLFVGQGLGHGVGMCQQGARQFAMSGRSYQFILKYYYPSLHLMRATNLAGASADVF